jgi:hypothetical protein
MSQIKILILAQRIGPLVDTLNKNNKICPAVC